MIAVQGTLCVKTRHRTEPPPRRRQALRTTANMHNIARFIRGFQDFQRKYFCDDGSLFAQLRQGQRPSTLVIACIDSRVDPAILMGSRPGELLVVRNVANLVPPYAPDTGCHGVSAALEFAVKHLQVKHIIVLGHSNCGGIQKLMAGKEAVCTSEFLDNWMDIACVARSQAMACQAHASPDVQQRACEQAGILVSLENLMTFPWVEGRVEAGKLHLHGWYFDLQTGDLSSYLKQSGNFELLTPPSDHL